MMEKMYSWKLCPWEQDTFPIKRGTGSEGFVFLCRGDTYLRYRSIYWITQLEVNIDWLLHSQSTLPVPQLDTTPTQQTMLKVECYPCHWRGHQFPTHIVIYPASQIRLQWRSYENMDGSQESKLSLQVVIVLVKIHIHSSDTVRFAFL